MTTPAQVLAPPSPEVAERARTALRRLVGRDDVDFRDGQLEAVSALVEHRSRVLVVQRTGWGKSAVYFVATALRRAEGAGPTVIISPLLALMRDQIAAAGRAGIRAVTMNSANAQDWDEVRAALAEDAVDVLLVSPERLNNPRFRDEQLPDLARRCGLLVVDEAHCVSDWGTTSAPTTGASATSSTACPPTSRCSRRPRPPTRASSTTSRSSCPPAAGRCSRCAAASPATRCGSGCSARCRPSSGSAGCWRTSASCPARASSTR